MKRIGREPCDAVLFGQPRQHLQQEWIKSVAGSHPGDKAAGHKQREITHGPAGLGRHSRGEIEQPAEFLRITHGIGQFPLPALIVEIGRRCRGPFVGKFGGRQRGHRYGG